MQQQEYFKTTFKIPLFTYKSVRFYQTHSPLQYTGIHAEKYNECLAILEPTMKCLQWFLQGISEHWFKNTVIPSRTLIYREKVLNSMPECMH